MARLLIAGNELYDYRADGWVEFNGSPTTSANQPGGRRTLQGNGGKYYYYLNASIGLNMLSRQLANVATGPTTGGYNEVYVRFAWNELTANNRTARNMFAFRNSNTGLFVGSMYCVDLNPNFGFNLRNGLGGSVLGSIGGIIQSAIPEWDRYELHFKCAASGGIFELWVNDVLQISATGLNTANGTTTVFDQVLIGQTDSTTLTNGWDDIAVNDLTGTLNNGRCGEGVVMAIFPTRAGSFNQLTNTYGTSNENYDHVNRPITSYIDPQNNSLYVGTSTAGNKDTYKLASLPQEIGAISAFKVVANCVRNGAALTNAKLLVEPGVVAQQNPITFTSAAGGSATTGTHLFTVVNKVGSGWSLPSLASAVFTAGANQTANLTVPTQFTETGTAPITSREIYATKANTDTLIAVASNGAVLPQATINVGSTAGFPASGTIYVTNSIGIIQTITYTGTSGGNQFTGCSGGVGTLVSNGLVTGFYYLVGTLNDNTTTAFVFNIADGSFGTQNQPTEYASANILLPNGAFGYIENIYDHNPTTGLAWSRDEVEQMEAGIQFLP